MPVAEAPPWIRGRVAEKASHGTTVVPRRYRRLQLPRRDRRPPITTKTALGIRWGSKSGRSSSGRPATSPASWTI